MNCHLDYSQCKKQDADSECIEYAAICITKQGNTPAHAVPFTLSARTVSGRICKEGQLRLFQGEELGTEVGSGLFAVIIFVPFSNLNYVSALPSYKI